ncbi:MAG: DUF308 domain-containing protein [Pseudobutyrivibrio sp.]|nr:DUF308 domain-containing protein [Pseudobutyrivibrio sp.]
MKEKIKEFRLNITIPAIFTIAIGVLLLLFPAESLATISKVIACIIVLSGVFIVINQIYERGFNGLGVAVGVILAIIGVWLFNDSGKIVNIIPIAIGVILVIHGVQDLALAIEAAKAHGQNAWFAFVLAIFNIFLGVLCIGASFQIVNLATRLIGAMMIWDGITDFGLVHSVRKATGPVVDGTITHEEDI